MLKLRILVLIIIGMSTLSMIAAAEIPHEIRAYNAAAAEKELNNSIIGAALADHLANIQKLDPQGLNNASIYEGQTPLYIAAANGYLEIVIYYVEKLISRGADINPPLTFGSHKGETPLFAGANNGQLMVVQYLVEMLERSGKNINPPLMNGCFIGYRPLDRAIYKGHTNVFYYYVEKLESRKEDSNSPRPFGKNAGITPFVLAAAYGGQAIFEWFVHKFQTEGKDINPPQLTGAGIGHTPYYMAAVEGQKPVVDFYIRAFELEHKDINPPLTDPANAGLTALYGAAYEGKLGVVDLIVRKLESQHKDINAPLTGAFQGFTPLYIAVRGRQIKVVEYYFNKLEKLNRNINPELTSGPQKGRTPLLEALKCRNAIAVKIFVWRGASVPEGVPWGDPDFSHAGQASKEELLYFLNTIAPLSLQLLNECYIVRDLLASNDAASIQKAEQALPRIRKLIEQGAEPYAIGKGGYSPLLCLIGYYDPKGPTVFDEAVKELIKSGKVFLNNLTDDGDSALTIAARFGNSRIHKLLMQKGANPKIGNDQIKTAIENNRSDFVRLLMKEYSPIKATGS